MRLTLHHHHDGVSVDDPHSVVYDVRHNTASAGHATVAGPALHWHLAADGAAVDALLDAHVELDPATRWIVRCDRVDFPPGGVAHTHTHPGPGIRYLLHGSLELTTGGRATAFGPGEAWFEPGPEPVLARASAREETAFVRVLLLPASWAGKRTITYVDPADEDKPKLQRATVLLEQPLAPMS